MGTRKVHTVSKLHQRYDRDDVNARGQSTPSSAVGKDCGVFDDQMGKGWVECVILGIDALLMPVVYVGCYA